MSAEFAPELRPVAFLLGTWRGEGDGEYPTIKPFRYREEIRFWHVGKPYLAYTQRTESADDGRLLHGEMGYLRLKGTDEVELVIAQPTGYAEIQLGRLMGTRIELRSILVGRTPTAKPVTAVTRTLWIEDDRLRYELEMAMNGVPLLRHLTATLQRVEAQSGQGR